MKCVNYQSYFKTAHDKLLSRVCMNLIITGHIFFKYGYDAGYILITPKIDVINYDVKPIEPSKMQGKSKERFQSFDIEGDACCSMTLIVCLAQIYKYLSVKTRKLLEYVLFTNPVAASLWAVYLQLVNFGSILIKICSYDLKALMVHADRRANHSFESPARNDIRNMQRNMLAARLIETHQENIRNAGRAFTREEGNDGQMLVMDNSEKYMLLMDRITKLERAVFNETQARRKAEQQLFETTQKLSNKKLTLLRQKQECQQLTNKLHVLQLELEEVTDQKEKLLQVRNEQTEFIKVLLHKLEDTTQKLIKLDQVVEQEEKF